MSNNITFHSSVDFPVHGIGPFLLHVKENCELIESSAVEIGFAHRGIEEALTKVNYSAGMVFVEKIDFLSAPACTLAFSLAIEHLCKIDLPEVAKHTRILLLELNRISNHLYFLAQIGKCVGSQSVFHFAFREREKYCDIFETYCGSRLLFQTIKVGGVCHPVTEGLISKIEKTFKETSSFLFEIENLLINNPIFQNRAIHIGKILKESIFKNNISGANARSTGVGRDLRKQAPYLGYDKYFVDVERKNLDSSGDVFSRVYFRMLEIKQSMAICEKIFQNIPQGNYCVPTGINFSVPKGEIYSEVESPKGILGVYIASNGGSKPDKVKFVCPSFFHLRMATKLLRTQLIEDIELILTSLDISISEVDR